MENIALISEFKQNMGDNVIAYVEKDKVYELTLRVNGMPRVRFHLQDENTGEYILCINKITTMITGQYTYKFKVPQPSLLVYESDGNGIVYIDHVAVLEGVL